MWFAMANNGASISWKSELSLLNLLCSDREKSHCSWSSQCAAYNSKGNVQSEGVPLQCLCTWSTASDWKSTSEPCSCLSGPPSQESSSSGFGLCSWCTTNSSSGTGTTALQMGFAVCKNSKSGSFWLRFGVNGLLKGVSVSLCSPALDEALGELVLQGFLDVGPLCFPQLLQEGEVLSFLGFTLQNICFPSSSLQTDHCLHVRRQALKTRGENKRYEWKET